MTEENTKTEDSASDDHTGDPCPHAALSCMNIGVVGHVHWLGYVRDPAPTEAMRSTGKPVVVYGDAPWEMSNEHILWPTDYPIRDGWGKRWVTYMTGDRRLAMGSEGARVLTDGSTMARVSEAIWQDAKSVGFRVVDVADHPTATWAHIADKLECKELSTVKLSAIVGMPGAMAMLGPALVPLRIIELLRELGVSEVQVCGRLDPVLARGVLLAMPVDGDLVPDDGTGETP